MSQRPLVLALMLAIPFTLASLPTEAATGVASAAKNHVGDKAAQLEQLYAEYWEASLKRSPLRATQVGDTRYNDLLPNTFTREYRDEGLAFSRHWLAKAEKIGAEKLSGQALLSYNIFVRDLKNNIEGERFQDWKMPLNQFRNVAGNFAQLGSGTAAQPFKTVKDYDNWLARASRIPVLMTTMQENMRVGMKDGFVQPKVLMLKVLPQLDALIKDKPEDTIFWKPVTNFPKDFTDADKVRLTTAYRDLIATKLMPSYRELRTFVAEQYLPVCRDTVALASLPDGDAWYAYRARMSTTTDLTPVQIHDIGLAEVARIQSEMDKVIQQVGFKGSRKEFFDYVGSDKKFEFKSEEDLLIAYRALEAKVNQKVPGLFSLLPKAAFEIRPVEAFRAQSAAGGQYNRPSEDGSRPGIFYVNTYDLPSRKTWDAESRLCMKRFQAITFNLPCNRSSPVCRNSAASAVKPRFRKAGVCTRNLWATN